MRGTGSKQGRPFGGRVSPHKKDEISWGGRGKWFKCRVCVEMIVEWMMVWVVEVRVGVLGEGWGVGDRGSGR